MSDEHRADVAGYEGNEVVRTPTLDQLARTGVVFRNAYTPSPICIPGRQSMMCGKLPRHCGCERFGEDLPPFSMTFARRLAEAGYATVCAGKLHHTGPDQMQGWTRRLSGDMSCRPAAKPAGWEASPETAGIPGKWSDTKELLRAGASDGPHLRADLRATREAEAYLESHFIDPFYDRPSRQPLLLKLSLNQPHYPYFTSEELFRYYLPRVRPFLDQPLFDHPFLSTRQVSIGGELTERDLQRATAAYYGMVETADQRYGEMLESLQAIGQNLDDWIIIYTSDHGEMLGEHGVWEKQKFFEGSVRVPLIIRWPQRFQPRVVNENVNLCDLFATLCELAGTETPAGLDSRSLVPLMQGHAASWDDETVSQFGGTNLMIKRGSLKYQWYATPACAANREVLFDLERDPAELRNWVDDPAYRQALIAFRQRRDALQFAPQPLEQGALA
jgi:choline-sulfatase